MEFFLIMKLLEYAILKKEAKVEKLVIFVYTESK